MFCYFAAMQTGVADPDATDAHPSVDNSRRFPVDRILRANGWRIFQRAKGCDPVWERRKDGKRVGQRQAVTMLDQAARDELRKMRLA